MPSCATETDFISAMKTEEQSLVPGSSSNAETPATPAGQLAPLAPAGKAPKRRQASCRVSWAQFRASKLPQIKADLERQWEMLMADAEARDLLTMRYDSASPHAALAQFREELDRMIVERTQTLERGAAASGPATRAPRSSSSDVPSPSALLRRLGLDAARLPSVALVFLDLSLHHKVDSDEEVLSALKELCGLSPLRRKALRSIVIYMARQQDSQIDAALGMTSQPARASGFGKFLQGSSWCTSSEAQHQFWKLTDEELGALLSDEVLPWQLASGPCWGVGPDLPGLGV